MKKILTAVLAGLLTTSILVSCGGDNGGSSSEDESSLSLLDPNVDSWTYDNSPFTINWYVNYSWFSYPNSGLDVISKKIKDLTGVTVNFTSPIDDSGQLLATMIAGDTLPDVITVQAYMPQATQLALEGYVHPINELARKYAPSLNNRIEDDIKAYYTLSDGNLYGLPSAAYSSKYVKEEDKWAPNGSMLVRKDWYEWYQSQPDKKDITTKDGLKDAMTRIKNQFGSQVSNLAPLLIDQFNADGNQSVTWLSQFFAAPFEDNNGNFIDQKETPQYKEALEYLNDLYRSGLIRSSNMTANSDDISGVVSRGEAFVSLVTPQNYPGSFINAYNNGIEYIPLIVRNSNGDDPILQDLTGNGFVLNMITKNAKRPDRIIKVFDFLYSEEGQRLVQFGIEGDTWEWKNEEKTQVKWTNKYLEIKNAGTLDSYGFGRFNTFYNPAYIEPIYPREGKKNYEVYLENLKRPLMPYSYRYGIAWPKLDVTKPNYLTVIKNEAKVQSVWSEYLPTIIAASNANNFNKGYKMAIMR